MYRKKSLLGKINQLCRIRGGYLFLTLMLLSSFLVSICLIGISLEIQEFVNIATRDSDGRIGRVFLFAGLTVFLYAAAMVAGTVLEAAYLNRTEKKLRLLLVGHMLDTKQEAVDSWHSSDVMTRLTVDVERITRLLPQIFGQMACEAIPAVLALIVMLRMNWKMALIMLAVVPCVVLIISLISPFQQKAAEKDMQNEEGNRSYMSEILTHLSLFRVYRMKETAMEETRELYGRKAKSRQSLSILQGITGFLNNFIGFALMFITKETLEQVLKQANLISVLEQMEGGLDHEVSESGGNLSMGQQQRIALARALYSRKPVLILDEPTANLDPDAVGLFWNTLRAVSADKIIIIVTHNMEIASKCDRVYFLQNGMLKEKAMG